MDLHQLLLATNEAGRRLSQRRGWSYRAGRLLPATPEQCGSARIVQSQGFHQALHGLRIREPAHASLQVRDAARAQSGLLGQRLLRQANGESVAPQQLAESPRLICRGCSHTRLAPGSPLDERRKSS